MAAEATGGFGQQPATFVVAQGLQVDPGRGRDLTASETGGHRAAMAVRARASSAFNTST